MAQLADLLMDAVDSGASIGFMPPLGADEALAYWRDVIAVMRAGRRVLLTAMDHVAIHGSVQINIEYARSTDAVDATVFYCHQLD